MTRRSSLPLATGLAFVVLLSLISAGAFAQAVVDYGRYGGRGPACRTFGTPAGAINQPQLLPPPNWSVTRHPYFGERYLTPPTGPRFPWLSPGYRANFEYFGPAQPRLLPGRSYAHPIDPDELRWHGPPAGRFRGSPWVVGPDWEVVGRWYYWDPYAPWYGACGRFEQDVRVREWLRQRILGHER